MTITNEGGLPFKIESIKSTVGAPLTDRLPAGITLQQAITPATTRQVTIELPADVPSRVFVDYLTIEAPKNVPPTLVTGFKATVY